MSTAAVVGIVWLLCAAIQAGYGQTNAPLKGVVWDIPADRTQAEADLRHMHRVGVEAVRTGIIEDEGLLTLADTLGLTLFQELPVVYETASGLVRLTDLAGRLLDDVLARMRRHPSARYVGLALLSDTSQPEACAYLRTLAARVRSQGGAMGRSYYVSAFAKSDRCADAVDLVLLDVREGAAPVERLAAWQQAHQTPAGLAAVGTWVASGAGTGWRAPHTPEAQARYLETQLRTLLADTLTASPEVVFVARWQDVSQTARAYGLLRHDGPPRPALDVVEGFFTGKQEVFAFPAGAPTRARMLWMMIAAWCVVALLGATYATSLRFRLMVPRYFRAHDFYRNAVRDGREALVGVSTAVLVAVALSAGLLLFLALDAVREEAAFAYVVRLLPGPLEAIAMGLLNQPWLLVLFVGSVYAILLALWAVGLSLVSRRRFLLAPEQTLALVVWPRWPLLVLMVAALAATSLPPVWQAPVLLALLGLGVASSLLAVGRTLRDYVQITGVAPAQAFVAMLVNPLVLLAVAALVLVVQNLPELRFAWHLATRG